MDSKQLEKGNTMTVGELIEILEDFDTDMEIRMVEQPNYPLEYNVYGIADYETDNGKRIAYICEGSQIGYASRDIWDCMW